MRNAFINTIIKGYKERDDIFILSGDAGLGVFDEFKEIYPDRFLNLGIAEQNMASFASGLSMVGYKVFVYNIIPFLLYRCYEQIRNDICYQRLPVVLIGVGSGVTYAATGMTHYSVEDIGIAQTLPNLVIISPIDPIEAKVATLYSLEAKNPVYIRLAKKGEPHIHSNDFFDITVPQIIKEGRDIAILFHGSISIEVIKAWSELTKKGIYPELISIPMIQPINIEVLLNILKDKRYVITIEEHFKNNGLGSVLSRIFVEYSPQWKLETMGIPYKFIHEIKDVDGMKSYFKISSYDIIKVIEGLVF